MTTATRFPVFDGHNDILYKLHFPTPDENRSFFERATIGHIDLPRAVEGGFGGGFFAIYIPSRKLDLPNNGRIETEGGYEYPMAETVEHAMALDTAVALVARLYRLERESEGQLKVVLDASDLHSCLHKGVLAAVMHFEGAEAIDTDLDALYVFHRAGLRSIGPVWSRPNSFAHGVPFRFPHSPDVGPGLTDAGIALIRACNELGIMIDCAHLNEKGFWDVARTSTAPLVSSHTAAHAICPSTRNITDRQIDAIGETGGMIGVNFNVRDIRPDGRTDVNTPLTDIVRHIDYIAERIGIDHVGFGSDFDGAQMSAELGDVSGLPRLVDALRGVGYDDAALRKVTHENWVRVLSNTWKA